jgi:hypothetical protein
METNGLLPCAHCNGKAEFYGNNLNGHGVECLSCKISLWQMIDNGEYLQFRTKEESRSVWNKRQSLEPLKEAINTLKYMCEMPERDQDDALRLRNIARKSLNDIAEKMILKD